MYKNICLLFLLMGCILTIHAQNDTIKASIPTTSLEAVQNKSIPEVKYHELSLNMSSILTQFVPFGKSTTITGPYNFLYRRVIGRNAFRVGLGANVIADDNRLFGFKSNVNTFLGYERIIPLMPKWSIRTGVGGMFFVGGPNVTAPNNNSNSFIFFNDIGFGAGGVLAVDYAILPKLSVGTEGLLFVGLRTTTLISVQAIPPLALYLSAKL